MVQVQPALIWRHLSWSLERTMLSKNKHPYLTKDWEVRAQGLLPDLLEMKQKNQLKWGWREKAAHFAYTNSTKFLAPFWAHVRQSPKESTQRTKTAKGVDQLCQHLTCLGERGKCCSKLQSLGNFSHFSSLPKLYLLLQKSRKRTRRKTLNKVFLKICLSTLHCLAY